MASTGPEIRVLCLKSSGGKLNGEAAWVLKEVWQLERRIFPKHESLASSLQQEVQRRNCFLLYALCPGEKQDGVVAGYVMFSCASLVASITKLAVREACRKSGYGEALLRAAIRHIQQRRMQCVSLHVDTTREPALALYRKLGFDIETTVESYYAPHRDAYRMVMSLENV